MRLLKSDLLPEERFLEILNLAAADPELEQRLLAALPLTTEEVRIIGERAHAAAAETDAKYAALKSP